MERTTCFSPRLRFVSKLLNQLWFKPVQHLKMTIWTSVLWKILMYMAKKLARNGRKTDSYYFASFPSHYRRVLILHLIVFNLWPLVETSNRIFLICSLLCVWVKPPNNDDEQNIYELKVSKFQKQIFLFPLEPKKTERKDFLISAP